MIFTIGLRIPNSHLSRNVVQCNPRRKHMCTNWQRQHKLPHSYMDHWCIRWSLQEQYHNHLEMYETDRINLCFVVHFSHPVMDCLYHVCSGSRSGPVPLVRPRSCLRSHQQKCTAPFRSRDIDEFTLVPERVRSAHQVLGQMSKWKLTIKRESSHAQVYNETTVTTACLKYNNCTAEIYTIKFRLYKTVNTLHWYVA